MSDSSSSLCPTCNTPLEAGICPRCLMVAAMVPTAHPHDEIRQQAPSLEAVAAAFPQLEILELIGQGGMGCVFKARQPKLHRLVALKLLPASLTERDPAFSGRFEREGRLLARLHHPNIVAVHDSGTAGEFFYLVMEFVDGVNLRQAMHARRFTPAQALAIVPHICDALQYAHDEGVLHRDIKPENILLDAKGRVKLADFGIAKLLADSDTVDATHTSTDATLTQSGATLGTPSYMAPEQRDTPSDVDHRADIYSLGVVFYELLTGELPRERFIPPSTKSDTDPRVDAIVQQALEKERDLRQHSANQVKTQVETLSRAAVVAPGSMRSQKPTAVMVLGIVLLILAIAVPVFGLLIHNQSMQLAAAEKQQTVERLRRELTTVSSQIGDANTNAGRAASRAGNSALPEEVRKQAREEQSLHEDRATKASDQLARVNARMAEASAAPIDSHERRAVFILLTMLPLAIAGIALLVSGTRPSPPVEQPSAAKFTIQWASVRRVMILHLLLAFACLWVIGWAVPKTLELLKDMMGATYSLPPIMRSLASLNRHFLQCVFTVFQILCLDLGLCILLSRATRHGLRFWNGLVILAAVVALCTMMFGLFSPLHPMIARLSAVATAESSSASTTETWSYTPRHLTEAKFLEWQKSGKAEHANLIRGTSIKFQSGTITLTGPRESVRPLATMMRVFDQPEIKNPLDLPIFNMPPEFFLRISIPSLMVKPDAAKSPLTTALRESLEREGVSAVQLARALSAHVLEVEKATFVNTGTPFESITRSPGASTFYDGTIPCADQPDKPLTLQIERTTQQMGTISKFASFAPWLIEEAKKQSKEPLEAAAHGPASADPPKEK